MIFLNLLVIFLVFRGFAQDSSSWGTNTVRFISSSGSDESGCGFFYVIFNFF
jgi:hypothetical protein